MSDLADIHGSQLLGRGLNKLDWDGEKKECQKVGDTDFGKREINAQGQQCSIGKYVTYEPANKEDYFIESFSSRDEYEKQIEATAQAKGRYGAFSGGFETTFGLAYKQLEEREAAIYSHSVSLWRLVLAVDANTTTTTFQAKVKELPKTFNVANSGIFFEFFLTFGADVITEVVVGGSLNYTMDVKKSYLDTKTTLKAMVEAEYGTFVSGKVTGSAAEEVKRHLAHRQSRLSTQGGTHSISFNPITPEDCSADFAKWRASLANAPQAVEIKLTPVHFFVADKDTRDALNEAYQWYTNHKVEIEANWTESVIVLGNQGQHVFANGSSGPALRTVFIDGATSKTEEHHYSAPAANASSEDFETFWNNVAAQLKEKPQHRLLLTTERWPKDRRYYPNAGMREALLMHGAHSKTLNRWSSLVQNMDANPLTGLTYALAGNTLNNLGIDGVTAGFGDPQRNLTPTVKISARLSHDSKGQLKVTATDKVLEDTHTFLYRLRNNTGDHPVLALDPKDRSRIVMQEPDAHNPGQLWYMPELEKPYADIKHPVLLINYETGTLLQGMLDQGDCRLKPIEPGRQQDDVIWDLRGSDVFHLLMVYHYPGGLCLTEVEKRAAVRKWREPHGMDWFREQQQPQH